MPSETGATSYELWIKACEEMGTDIWPLAAKGPGTKLFKVTHSYTQNNRTYYASPVYIGWVNGEQVVAGQNYHEAMQVWKNRAKKAKPTG